MDIQELIEVIDTESDGLCALSDAIWDHPEMGYQETASANLQMDFLKAHGFSIQSPAFGIATAFTAQYGSGAPRIGILGEFDALSCLSQVADGPEESPLVPGAPGHGCGHNLLGVASIGGALAVKEYLQTHGVSGTVIYFGCPAEENGSGKAFMAREGAFASLDCALTWHPGTLNKVYAESSLANEMTLYHFKGKSSHAAAAPEYGRSALDAVELMNVGVNFLREHVVQEARMHYAITNAGGLSPNVVPAKADVLYMIRLPDVSQLGELQQRVNDIARGAALMTGTQVSWETIKACANYLPNRTLSEEVYQAMQDIPLPSFSEKERAYAKQYVAPANAARDLEKVVSGVRDRSVAREILQHRDDVISSFLVPYDADAPLRMSYGSTDVGDVSWNCPTAQFVAATWAPGTPGHTWQVVAQGKGDIAHKMMLWSAKVIGLSAIRILQNPSSLKAVKEEFQETMQTRAYRPLSAEVKPRPVADLVS